jgi:hypothetical protein
LSIATDVDFLSTANRISICEPIPDSEQQPNLKVILTENWCNDEEIQAFQAKVKGKVQIVKSYLFLF